MSKKIIGVIVVFVLILIGLIFYFCNEKGKFDNDLNIYTDNLLANNIDNDLKNIKDRNFYKEFDFVFDKNSLALVDKINEKGYPEEEKTYIYKDKDNVYVLRKNRKGEQKVIIYRWFTPEIIDEEEFEIEEVSKDESRFYSQDHYFNYLSRDLDVLTNINTAGSYTPVYHTDKNGAYFRNELITTDLENFEILGSGFSIDNENLFLYDSRLTAFTDLSKEKIWFSASSDMDATEKEKEFIQLDKDSFEYVFNGFEFYFKNKDEIYQCSIQLIPYCFNAEEENKEWILKLIENK
ncbi:MAG: DKNYY domain-containing protein [Candidatus Moranbacteria bacterium]|nr:DKNYY domain-containing protein [Candidatus Moranbacteria bacterium]